MAIVWLRNSRDVSEKTISGPGGFGKTAAGNEKPRSFGVQRVVTTLLSFGRFRAICNSVLEQTHFSYLWGRNDPFISRKVLQSHMQFGFGTSAFFSYLCRAIRNSGLSWLNGKIWKIYLSSQVHILLAVQPAPYGMEYGFLRHYGAGYMRLLLQRFSRAVRWVSKQ